MTRWLVILLLFLASLPLYAEEVEPEETDVAEKNDAEQPVIKSFLSEKKAVFTLAKDVAKLFQALIDEVESSELFKAGYAIENVQIDPSEVTIELEQNGRIYKTFRLVHPSEDCSGDSVPAFCVTLERSPDATALVNDPLEARVRQWIGAAKPEIFWRERHEPDARRSIPPPEQQLPILNITEEEMTRLYEKHPNLTIEQFEHQAHGSAVPDKMPDLGETYAELTAQDRPDTWKQGLQAALLPVLLFVYVILRRYGRAAFHALLHAELPDEWLPSTPRNQWILLGIFLVGAIFRAINLGGIPMQIDEWSNVEFLPLKDVIFHGYETLTNPPLLYAIEHVFYPVSTHPAWFRLPLFLFGVVLLWAVWRAGRTLFDERTGMLAAGLAALHPALTVFSQTVRAYEPAACLLMLALPHVWRISRRTDTDKDFIAFGLLATLALWMHYPSLLMLGPMFFMMFLGVRRYRANLEKLEFTAIWVAVSVIPLMPFFFAHSGKQGSGFFPQYFSQSFDFITGMPFKTGVLMLAVMLFARAWKHDAWRWLVWLSGFTVAAYIVGSTQIMHVPHYTVILIPPFLLLLAAALVSLKPRLYQGATSAFLAVMALVQISLPLMPSQNLFMAHLAYTPMQRGMSHGVFAEVLLNAEKQGEVSCRKLLTAPNYDKETYLYYFDRKTLQDVGLQPFVEHSEASIEVDLGEGAQKKLWTLKGLVLLGDYKGRELDERLKEEGCFWYSRMHQNCSHESGVLYDPFECDWLAQHCTLKASTAMDELYFCAADRPPDHQSGPMNP